jgi:hypothetical protein
MNEPSQKLTEWRQSANKDLFADSDIFLEDSAEAGESRGSAEELVIPRTLNEN